MSTGDSMSWLRRWNMSSLVILVILCAADLLIPLHLFLKYEQIYRDLWPGADLPSPSQWVFPERILLMILACVWPLLGLVLTAWKKAAARLWLRALQGVALLQCILTVAALLRLIVASTGSH